MLEFGIGPWEASMSTLEGGLSVSNPEARAAKHSFHTLRVSQVIRETDDACSLVFEIPAALREVFEYRAGQFLTLEVPYQGATLRRCYSLASCPETEREHKVTIKRVEGGRISNWIHDQVSVGSMLRVLPPEGRFVMRAKAEHMLMFAGGSGITPVIAIIKSALASTDRKIELIYANRNAASVIFDAELKALVAQYPTRFRYVSRLDNVDGFLRIADITRLLSGRTDGEYFLCGPEGFMHTVERGLLAGGVDSERIHVERFVSLTEKAAPSESGAEQLGDVPEQIKVELQGKAYDVPYVRGQSLLKSALDAGLDAPYSCEEGFCGSCTARLLDGTVEMQEDDALTAEEKKKGYVLACQAKPTSRTCTIRFLDF